MLCGDPSPHTRITPPMRIDMRVAHDPGGVKSKFISNW